MTSVVKWPGSIIGISSPSAFQTLFVSGNNIGISPNGNEVALPTTYPFLELSSLGLGPDIITTSNGAIFVNGVAITESNWSYFPAENPAGVDFAKFAAFNLGNTTITSNLSVLGFQSYPYWNTAQLDANITTANANTTFCPTNIQYLSLDRKTICALDPETLPSFAFQSVVLCNYTYNVGLVPGVAPVGVIYNTAKDYTLLTPAEINGIPYPSGTVFNGFARYGVDGYGPQATISMNNNIFALIAPNSGASIDIIADSVLTNPVSGTSRITSAGGRVQNFGTYQADMAAGVANVVAPFYDATCYIQQYAIAGYLGGGTCCNIVNGGSFGAENDLVAMRNSIAADTAEVNIFGTDDVSIDGNEVHIGIGNRYGNTQQVIIGNIGGMGFNYGAGMGGIAIIDGANLIINGVQAINGNPMELNNVISLAGPQTGLGLQNISSMTGAYPDSVQNQINNLQLELNDFVVSSISSISTIYQWSYYSALSTIHMLTKTGISAYDPILPLMATGGISVFDPIHPSTFTSVNCGEVYLVDNILTSTTYTIGCALVEDFTAPVIEFYNTTAGAYADVILGGVYMGDSNTITDLGLLNVNRGAIQWNTSTLATVAYVLNTSNVLATQEATDVANLSTSIGAVVSNVSSLTVSSIISTWSQFPATHTLDLLSSVGIYSADPYLGIYSEAGVNLLQYGSSSIYTTANCSAVALIDNFATSTTYTINPVDVAYQASTYPSIEFYNITHEEYADIILGGVFMGNNNQIGGLGLISPSNGYLRWNADILATQNFVATVSNVLANQEAADVANLQSQISTLDATIQPVNTWSQFAAIQDVEYSSFNINNVAGISAISGTFGNITAATITSQYFNNVALYQSTILVPGSNAAVGYSNVPYKLSHSTFVLPTGYYNFSQKFYRVFGGGVLGTAKENCYWSGTAFPTAITGSATNLIDYSAIVNMYDTASLTGSWYELNDTVVSDGSPFSLYFWDQGNTSLYYQTVSWGNLHIQSIS